MSKLTSLEKAKKYDARVARDRRERVRRSQVADSFWMGGSAVGFAGLTSLILTKWPRARFFDGDKKIPTQPILGGAAFVLGAAFEMPVIAGMGLGPVCAWVDNTVAQQSWARPSNGS